MKTVNKNLILSLFNKMNEFKSTNIKSILETYFDKNVTVNVISPFKELTNIKEFNDAFWIPLFNSFMEVIINVERITSNRNVNSTEIAAVGVLKENCPIWSI